jgi:hypothetical protein
MTRHKAGVLWRRSRSLPGLLLTCTVLGCPSAVSRQASTTETREILVAESTEQAASAADPGHHGCHNAPAGSAERPPPGDCPSRRAAPGAGPARQSDQHPPHVTGSILPNKVVLGTLMGVQDFLCLYQTP